MHMTYNRNILAKIICKTDKKKVIDKEVQLRQRLRDLRPTTPTAVVERHLLN